MAYMSPLNGGRINASISGNTTGTAALISSGTMYLSGGSNITLSQSSNTLGILGPTFINSNGLTFGTNGSQITASVANPSGTNSIGASGGNVSGNAGYISGSNLRFAFAGGTNITLSQSTNNNSATMSIIGPSFSNSNNVSLGISNNGVVTASASFNQSLQTSNVIQALSANGSSAATGTITFSNSNNVSFGMNGNVITASAAGGGGGGGVAISATNSLYSSGTLVMSAATGALTISGTSNSLNFGVPATSMLSATGGVTLSTAGSTVNIGAPAISSMVGTNGLSFSSNVSTISAGLNISKRWEELYVHPTLTNITNLTAINGRPIFQPFFNGGNLTVNRLEFELSRSTSGSNLFTVFAGIYSYQNGTLANLIASLSNSFSNTLTASVSGIVRFALTGFDVTTFSAGEYVIGLNFTASAANTASMNYSIRGGAPLGNTYIQPGPDNIISTGSFGAVPFLGRYSSTSVSMPLAIFASSINAIGTNTSMSAVNWWMAIQSN